MSGAEQTASGKGSVCEHGIRWPWACDDCDRDAWAQHQRETQPSEDPSDKTDGTDMQTEATDIVIRSPEVAGTIRFALQWYKAHKGAIIADELTTDFDRVLAEHDLAKAVEAIDAFDAEANRPERAMVFAS